MTSSWGVACFSGTSGTGDISIRFKQSSSEPSDARYKWDRNTPVNRMREGPVQRRQGQNQSVFIRGYKVSIREGIEKLLGPVKVSSTEHCKPGELFSRGGTSVPYENSSDSESATPPGSSNLTAGVSEGDITVDHVPDAPEVLAAIRLVLFFSFPLAVSPIQLYQSAPSRLRKQSPFLGISVTISLISCPVPRSCGCCHT